MADFDQPIYGLIFSGTAKDGQPSPKNGISLGGFHPEKTHKKNMGNLSAIFWGGVMIDMWWWDFEHRSFSAIAAKGEHYFFWEIF